ncbi:universal stress protein [Halomonas sp. Bachu 37]|uniref:universal stress protein n=1 Tax=Halomonas kashgarensis TaxID=3084920 RepID=UPI003217F396
MFNKIMIPVDLAHLDAIKPALDVAADMAGQYQASICYVGVTATTPGSVARTPQEYEQKLQAFAQAQHEAHGHPVDSKMIASPDPTADLDDDLIQAIEDTQADLVIMATHLPKHLDAIMPSHGGKVASHTKASILLVRPPETSR